MKLRTQLLLVSLFILVLPWAGCQYIREMEDVFLESQSRELNARGQAIAAHLRSQANTLISIENGAKKNIDEQIYFHRLNAAPIIDGSPDDDWPLKPLGFVDWREPTIESRPFVNPNNKTQLNVLSGLNQNNAYFYISVIDDAPLFHDPQQASVASGDHFLLRIGNGFEQAQSYILRASGQGPFSARYVNPEGNIRQEHRIRGFWRSTNQGYQVEVSIPQNLLGPNIDFAYQKADGTRLGTYINQTTIPERWIATDINVESIIQLYGDFQTRIEVVDANGWLLAQAGNFHDTSIGDSQVINWQWFLSGLYQLALSNLQLPAMDIPFQRGRIDSEEVTNALSGEEETRWYQQGNQRVARSAFPIQLSGRIVGAVAVTQSTESLIAGTNSAFNRLFYYLAVAIAALGLSLFAFATLLSFRIRRLSKAADNAIGEDGKIRPEFIRSGFNDEIGDLTRSYGLLLTRLRDYTDYLRSLASKLSHELRTPLAVVRSSLENLDHSPDGDNAHQYRQRAKEGAERLANILSAMSSASRMEDSIRNTPTENFRLDQLLTEVVEAYRGTYINNNIVLDIAQAADFSVHGSPDLIVQMLDKLVDNASDFCPAEGEIRLTLNRAKNSLLLSVSNTGPLLPEHMQGQLFDSLVSVREAKGQKTHLGLGLFIVRLIVDFHSGQVQGRNMDSKNGVSFDIRLPTLVVD